MKMVGISKLLLIQGSKTRKKKGPAVFQPERLHQTGVDAVLIEIQIALPELTKCSMLL